jgi:hypothetical protein
MPCGFIIIIESKLPQYDYVITSLYLEIFFIYNSLAYNTNLFHMRFNLLVEKHTLSLSNVHSLPHYLSFIFSYIKLSIKNPKYLMTYSLNLKPFPSSLYMPFNYTTYPSTLAVLTLII